MARDRSTSVGRTTIFPFLLVLQFHLLLSPFSFYLKRHRLCLILNNDLSSLRYSKLWVLLQVPESIVFVLFPTFLWLGLVWSCFLFCLLFLLFYVICTPVLTEGTILSYCSSCSPALTATAKEMYINKDTHKVSLVGMCAFKKFMCTTMVKRMRHCCSHLRTKEMLDDVEDDV